MGDWKKLEDGKEKYQLYLCSREWSVLKESVHERAGGICERCRMNPIDAVHHLTYARKYCERLDDLQGTCRPCHQFIHGKIDIDPLLQLEDCEPACSKEWLNYIGECHKLQCKPIPDDEAKRAVNINPATMCDPWKADFCLVQLMNYEMRNYEEMGDYDSVAQIEDYLHVLASKRDSFAATLLWWKLGMPIEDARAGLSKVNEGIPCWLHELEKERHKNATL